MIAREMIAEKVFAESVAKDIRNFLPVVLPVLLSSGLHYFYSSALPEILHSHIFLGENS